MNDQPNNPIYDEVPYPDLCHSLTHPGRVAAIAILLGLKPAPVERCRVLELGCAKGGNLLPMAYGLPESTFVGIDSSARQIERAQQNAEKLGLTNITFHHKNILEVTPAFGQFDYIIAHGIYSWIPADVRDKLLTICKENLAPQGIAYVSYNTLPGWHMLLMMREMMLYHVRKLTDPLERARAAHRFIDNLVEIIPLASQSAYTAVFDAYLDARNQAVAGNEDWHNAVLLHDELAEVNEPLYFHQFAEQAAAHGLGYVADANFTRVLPSDLPGEAVERLQTLAQDTLEMEQYLDFVRNQSFRRTLLCDEALQPERILRVERVRGLYAVSHAVPVEDDRDTPPSVKRFRSADGAVFSTDHPLTAAALDILSSMSPRAMSYTALLSAAARHLGIDQASDGEAQTLAVNLLQAFGYSLQLVELLAYDPAFTVDVSERPTTSPVVLHLAGNVPLVSNLRHEQVELDGLAFNVLRMLDGQHSRANMLEVLLGFVGTGEVAPPRPDMTPVEIREVLGRDLDRTLHWLSHAALLQA